MVLSKFKKKKIKRPFILTFRLRQPTFTFDIEEPFIQVINLGQSDFTLDFEDPFIRNICLWKAPFTLVIGDPFIRIIRLWQLTFTLYIGDPFTWIIRLWQPTFTLDIGDLVYSDYSAVANDFYFGYRGPVYSDHDFPFSYFSLKMRSLSRRCRSALIIGTTTSLEITLPERKLTSSSTPFCRVRTIISTPGSFINDVTQFWTIFDSHSHHHHTFKY